MYEKLGKFFHKLARFCFSHVPGICWNCGAHCEVSFTIARGLWWCDACFNKWQHTIRDDNFIFNWRYFGYPKSALKKYSHKQ